MTRKKKLQSGFSLIESIIAIIILVSITVVLYSVYLFNQQAYRESENMAELTQNGRVVLERITRELRQAAEMVTVLPQTDQGAGNPTEIEFQDGHVLSLSVTSTATGGSTSTIILAADSVAVNDYYNDIFLRIIGGTGQTQIRKIIGYNGSTKTATVGEDWSVIPDSTSVYRLGSEDYYIRYYIPIGDNEIHRQYRVYCFDPCGTCNDYFDWEDIRIQVPTSPSACVLEDRVIGEYISSGDLRFWGSDVINVLLRLNRFGQEINLSTKIFGRNF